MVKQGFAGNHQDVLVVLRDRRDELLRRHGLCAAFEPMAAVDNEQNKGGLNYRSMVGNFKTSFACKAATDPVSNSLDQPSGYTEPLLHA